MGPNVLLGIIFGMLALALPRRRAFGAVLAAGTCTTYGDALDLGGLSFYSIRIVIMFVHPSQGDCEERTEWRPVPGVRCTVRGLADRDVSAVRHT
jgi:hypothetical protein